MMMRWMVAVCVLAALASVVSQEAASAAVLCQKPSGVLCVRDPACKRKETQVTPESLGLVGPSGPQGNLGPPGPTGPAGRSALTPLQSGETISGLWGHGLTVADPANDFFDIVSFPIPLAADLSDTNVDYVSAGDTDPNCPGPGMAATGFLCVYETDTENASTRFSFNIFKSSDPGGPGGASKYGFAIRLEAAVAGETFTGGVYSVTAP